MFHCSQIGGNQGKKSIGTELDAIQVVLKYWRKSHLIVGDSNSSDAGSRGRRMQLFVQGLFSVPFFSLRFSSLLFLFCFVFFISFLFFPLLPRLFKSSGELRVGKRERTAGFVRLRPSEHRLVFFFILGDRFFKRYFHVSFQLSIFSHRFMSTAEQMGR